MVCQKSNRAFTYRKSRGAHVHVSNEWKWVAWYEDMTTWTFHVLKAWNDRKSIVRILYTIQRSKRWRFDTVGLESNDSSQQMTIRHTGCRFAVSCKSTSGMTGRHFFVTSRSIGVESCRFDNICNPLSQTLSEYILFSCKLISGMRFRVIRDGFSELRHHNTSKPRIDFRFDDSSTAFDDSQRFGCIGQPSKLRSREYKKWSPDKEALVTALWNLWRTGGSANWCEGVTVLET